MVLPIETIATGAYPTCSECKVTPKLQVYCSFAGFYIGSYCNCGPYSLGSKYYSTREQADAALKAWFER